ncbi:amidohydrolase family protein [Maribacter sp. 2307UL18-2]|uniref:amidohydrolase family protein n=1 Tax=Maribacter sp. 2307UL18-2 TaxID=3386274 RepID=UPI0039BC4DFE
MKNQRIVAIGILCLVLSLTGCTTTTYDLAIQNVRLFDSKNKTVHENRTVLINADTIAAIVDATDSYSAKETINGDNRLMTPGLIDTHTHLMQNYTSSGHSAPKTITEDKSDLARGLMTRMYLAHGVTTIIDMGQPEAWIDVTLNWQQHPSPEYPNLFICGGSIVSDASYRQPQHHIEVMNPEDGRKKVREYAKKGLKHMKLYRKLEKPDFEAMVDEAKKHDITINTHTDNNVMTIDEAMDMGVRNFEHFFTVTPSILDYDEHWKAMNAAYGIQMSPSIDEFAAHMTFFFSYIKEHPEFETKLMALFDRMAAKGATLSTALNVLASAAGRTDFFTSFEYFPIRRTPMVSYSAAQQKQLNEAFDYMMLYVKKAHDKGVQLRVGTDCRYGGKAMLHELLLFHEAGISMEDILQIATRNGYEAMNLQADYGSIEVGKKADMLLFEKNPFDTPENLLSNKTIIKGGKVFSLKKSLAYSLQDILVDQGPKKGLTWFKKEKESERYEPLNADELEKVVHTFSGDGRIDEAQTVLRLFQQHFPERKVSMDENILTNGTYALINKKEYDKAIEFYEFAAAYSSEATKNGSLAVLIKMLEEGIPKAKEYVETIKTDEKYVIDENEINSVGYLLLRLDKPLEAIAFFELNVKLFPESWNVYDSLGEGYMSVGQKKSAIKNYRKSIALNPENNYGKAQLKKLIAQ